MGVAHRWGVHTDGRGAFRFVPSPHIPARVAVSPCARRTTGLTLALPLPAPKVLLSLRSVLAAPGPSGHGHTRVSPLAPPLAPPLPSFPPSIFEGEEEALLLPLDQGGHLAPSPGPGRIACLRGTRMEETHPLPVRAEARLTEAAYRGDGGTGRGEAQSQDKASAAGAQGEEEGHLPFQQALLPAAQTPAPPPRIPRALNPQKYALALAGLFSG